VPKEVLHDQGTQQVSGIMKEFGRLLSVKQLSTTPYHAMCNGLIEGSSGTLKATIVKMCQERPTDWNLYTAPVLFAYRESPQESLGFSPFELLHWRTVLGPTSILHELWAREEIEPEVKSTYQYVLDLKERLRDTCELKLSAMVETTKSITSTGRRRTYFNIFFKPANKVLILLLALHTHIYRHIRPVIGVDDL
jgi:hypothetical protein